MSSINLEDLGLTQEKIQDRVVEAIVDRLLTSEMSGEDERTWLSSSAFKNKLDEQIKKRIDQRIAELGAAHVLPKLDGIIDNLVIQETTRYGEKRGKPASFIEYMIARAEAYISEPVDSQGRSEIEVKAQQNSWYGSKTTRVAYQIHEHLSSNINEALKKMLADANSKIAGGLRDAITIQLNKLLANFKVTVQTDR